MTNSLGHTLEIKHDRIDPIILSAIKAVNAIARAQGIPYVLAGATARELILRNVFGRPPGRRTLDVDFAVAVHDWAQFEGMKNTLVQSGLFQSDAKHLQRVRYPGAAETVIVDLIPFGDIETAERTIAWPPKGDTIMHVAGFVEALESAVQIRLEEEFVVPVVCVPALIVLKLFAWLDRKQTNSKDAEDIFTILREYGDAGNEDRIYSEYSGLLEAEEFDFELAGARLAGIDVASLISADTAKRLRELLISDQHVRQLIDQITSVRGGIEAEQAARCELLVSRFRSEFLDKSLAKSLR